ncbi:hypothetical protein AGMMS50268_37490 [Spirochaetia bacterium]|nr:hypothetical protein AGMMS49546_36060 [Spirochaetia bacterium]GHV93246.1 hypothetical protein AGMMS50268_37490 [Spirochaetia bacterium]
MNDIDHKDVLVPARTLEKLGVAAVGNLAGGVFLFIMGALGTRLPIVGIIMGVVSGVIGLGALFSRDPEDKKPGAVLLGGGVLVILSRVGAAFIRPLAGTVLSVGAVGLFAMGILKGLKFLKGLKSRG